MIPISADDGKREELIQNRLWKMGQKTDDPDEKFALGFACGAIMRMRELEEKLKQIKEIAR